MIVASTAFYLSNLLYLIGAIVAMVLLSVVVVLRQRKPKSVEANMAVFQRGLDALAPGAPAGKRPGAVPARRPQSVQSVGRIEVRRPASPSAAPAAHSPRGEHDTEAGTG